jgi:hypothetical protein
MNILVIIKVSIHVLSNGSHKIPLIMDYLAYNNYHSLNTQSNLFSTYLFLVSILEATLDHILPKCKSFSIKSN